MISTQTTEGKENIEGRLRRFLLLLSLLAVVGAVTELWLVDHDKEPLQLVPFFLCGIALIALVVALLRASRSSLQILRIVMVVVGLGGVMGIGIHLWRNFSFEQDVHPNAAMVDDFFRAIKGAAPLLAPGVLLFAALLAITATYRHPALSAVESNPTGNRAQKN